MNNLIPPKEKAKELIEKFRLINYDLDDTINHKEGALITIDEIIKYHNSLFELGLKNVYQTFNTPNQMYNDVLNPIKKYLLQIKHEIEIYEKI
jgi:hypothetical protein